MMSADVSSLETVRQRVEELAQSLVGGLESLNATVNDIETRSAAALNASQQASQVTVVLTILHQHFASVLSS